jgi:acetyltransferase-like isoleucine patch superfamily enzyme
MKESFWRGVRNRVLQLLARTAPGAETLRVTLHRARGVKIGKNVWIGYDAILDTSRPELITIEDRVSLGIRVTIIAHFREASGVRIEREAFIGPSVTVLPNVVIGHGAVISAGSVVTRSIPPMVMAQGNPAVPVARCGVALTSELSLKEFSGRLMPLSRVPSRRTADKGDSR